MLGRQVHEIRRLHQRPWAEDLPRLLADKLPAQERHHTLIHVLRGLGYEAQLTETLHAEHFIDQQTGKYIMVLDHQHPALFAHRHQFMAENPHRSMSGNNRPRRLAIPATQNFTPGITA